MILNGSLWKKLLVVRGLERVRNFVELGVFGNIYVASKVASTRRDTSRFLLQLIFKLYFRIVIDYLFFISTGILTFQFDVLIYFLL